MIQASDGYALEFNLDDRNKSLSTQDWESDRPEVEEVPAYVKRRSAGVWTCLATLSVVLALVVVYGYTVLKQEGIQLEQVPGMTRSLSAIGQHLANVEVSLAHSRLDQQKLALQVQSIDAGTKAALSVTQQQTRQLIAHVQGTLLNQMKQQTTALQAQVSQLVGERKADRTQLAQLEDQLTQARAELETTRADYAHQIAALREQQGEEHQELASLSNSLPTRQVTFEVQKNQTSEVIPGVSFQLTKTDVERQRFDGFIESLAGHQRVSVQSQGVRSPVVFFPSEHNKACVMVVTSVDQKGAVGYLLIPASNGTTDQTDFISSTDTKVNPTTVPSGSESSVADP